jgi:gas vesicle protein
MRYENSQDDGTYAADTLLTFAIGAAAGAALALMFAPGSGRETRSMLAERSRRAADRAREMAEKGRHMATEQGATVSSAIERGREKAMAFAGRVGEAVEQGKSSYRDALRQGQDAGTDFSQRADSMARSTE